MNKLERVEVVMEGGPCGPELQVVNMTDGPFYYADEADKRIAELEDQNMRLRLALLELKERYSCSPWIHRQVDEAIRKEIDNE